MNSKSDDPNVSLPLPTDPQKPKTEGDTSSGNPAAELIRRKVEAAYAAEPDVNLETKESQSIPEGSRSRHQQFIYELASSGKNPIEVQMAWHEYYAELSDVEKHQVWQEFYTTQAASSSYPIKPAESRELISSNQTLPQAAKDISNKITGLKDNFLRGLQKRQPKPNAPVRSLLFGLSVGLIVVVLVLFGFFNERFIAPFIQPSRSLSSVPLITDTAVGSEPEIVIPKINVQIPVVYGIKSIEEPVIQEALKGGVLHYADTALPGQNGNVVIVGHSSNNIFNNGKYKFAFVLLSRLEPGDTFYLQKEGRRYSYEVYQKKIVRPDDVSVLGPADRAATATLITCDPPGTSINRLVVTGEQISPDPTKNKPTNTSSLATQTKTVPSNAQSLWARIWDSLSR